MAHKRARGILVPASGIGAAIAAAAQEGAAEREAKMRREEEKRRRQDADDDAEAQRAIAGIPTKVRAAAAEKEKKEFIEVMNVDIPSGIEEKHAHKHLTGAGRFAFDSLFEKGVDVKVRLIRAKEDRVDWMLVIPLAPFLGG